MKTLLVRTLAVVALIFAGRLYAQAPLMMNHQGRIAVDGVNFDGTGSFKFALVNAAGTTTYWSNDGTSVSGSQPAAAVSLAVTKGLYSVLLGDTSLANMTAVPASVFNNADVRLRVWFSNGPLGFQQLAPDARIGAAGYAMTAAQVAASAIGTTQLADSSVTGAKIAGGSVDSVQLANNAVTAAKIGSAQVVKSLNALKDDVTLAAGPNVTITPSGNTLTIAAPGGGTGPWSVSSGHAYYNGGSVGIGTDSPVTRFTLAGAGGYNSPGAAAITLDNLAAARRWEWHVLDDGRMQLADFTLAATRLVIDTAGNVGIGTASPSSKLTVFSPGQGFEHTDGSVRLGSYVSGFGGWLGTISNDKLNFFVNNGVSPGMTVDTTGNVGIGTNTPANKLSVSGSADFSGNVGIGTTTPAHTLDVNGTARVNGRLNVNSDGSSLTTMLVRSLPGDIGLFLVENQTARVFELVDNGAARSLTMWGNASKSSGGTSWGVASDQRLKQNVREYETGLSEILQLRPVRFRYRDDVKKGLTSAQEEVGFIAQEVREVIPDAVTEGEDGYLALKADPIHWAAINAIQELNGKLDKKNAEVQQLKDDVAELRGMIAKLAANR